MMIDIWDELWGEKPKAIYQGTWLHGEPDDKIYESVDMDAWLEKLKAQWKRERTAIDMIDDSLGQAHAELGGYTCKIEAIKTFIKSKANSNDPAYSICVGVLSILGDE